MSQIGRFDVTMGVSLFVSFFA